MGSIPHIYRREGHSPGDPVTNPMGWEAAPLREVIKVKSGDGLVAKDMAPNGEFPVYGGNGINGCHNKYMFDESKIILGRVGVYCGVVHLTKPRAWVTDNAGGCQDSCRLNVLIVSVSPADGMREQSWAA